MSTISPLTPAASTSASIATDKTPNSSQSLSQNDFLKLLVAQMQYQDPSNPQSDTQMASQMAQFSTLTASTQMSSSLSMLQANNLIGTSVMVQVTPGSNSLTSGLVTGVTLASGSPQVIVTDPKTGKPTPYNLSQVVSVSPPLAAPAATTSAATTPPAP